MDNILGILFLVILPLVTCQTYDDVHVQSPLDEIADRTYLRVLFPGGEEEHYRNWECSDGVWAEDMHLKRKPSCVCVKGAYAVGSKLCDDDFRILTGNNHCFDVSDMTVRKILPLTGKDGFSGRASTVFRKDIPYVARLISSTPTTSVPEPMHYIIRVNDPTDFSIYAKVDNGEAARLKCFLAQDVNKETFEAQPTIQIGKLPNCSNEFRGPKAWCDDYQYAQEYDWTLSIGQSWSMKTGQIGNGEQYPGKCKEDTKAIAAAAAVTAKGTKRRAGRKRRSLPRKKTSGRSDKPAPVVQVVLAPVIEPEPTCDQFADELLEAEEFNTTADHFYDYGHTDQSQVFHSTSYHQKLVNKQNNRVGHQLLKFFLAPNGSDSVPKLKDFPEYMLVQIGKELLKKVCPPEHVSPNVTDFLIRAFRLLYIDSAQSFPYPHKTNEIEHERILAALSQCNNEAKPISFVDNATCRDAGIHATNQSFNESTFLIYDAKINLTMPADVRFNLSSLDVALELVWKIKLLAHYYCAEQLAAVNPIDLSSFFVKIELMLKNPMMLFRWYYPGQFNRLLQFFLMGYDMVQFAKGVDRCVATAQAGSVFKGWVRRPAEVSGWLRQTNALPHPVNRQTSFVVGNLGNLRAGRKKRFYLQDDLWKKQAYCMHNTDAPYNEVRTETFISCRRKPVWFQNTD